MNLNVFSCPDERGGECCHGRNPVRRSNSSPEMSSNWKNTYMKDSSRSFNSSPVHDFEHASENVCSLDCRKGGKCYAKELRYVSIRNRVTLERAGRYLTVVLPV